MATFFTSDLHLGHENIIKFCKRPFNTIKGHDETIIRRINERVWRNDELWILGDFTLKKDYETVRCWRNQLTCDTVHLVWGNHDHFLPDPLFVRQEDYCLITVEGQQFFLCHYPMRAWPNSHRGSWHLYGHVHGNLADTPHLLTLDVGVDTHEFYPWSFEEIAAYMKPRIPAHEAYIKTWKAKEEGGMAPGTHD